MSESDSKTSSVQNASILNVTVKDVTETRKLIATLLKKNNCNEMPVPTGVSDSFTDSGYFVTDLWTNTMTTKASML